MPPSQNEQLIAGLNLLRLLVQNRIAEFHTELELIPQEVSVEHAAITACAHSQVAHIGVLKTQHFNFIDMQYVCDGSQLPFSL